MIGDYQRGGGYARGRTGIARSGAGEAESGVDAAALGRRAEVMMGDDGRQGSARTKLEGRMRTGTRRVGGMVGPGPALARIGWAVGAPLVGLLLGVGCASGAETGAECPPESELSWEGFGHTFMDTYCVRCHSGYASQDRVRSDAFRIDMQAGAGPDAVNTAMPRSGVKPTMEEREALSTWLACDAP